MKLLKVSVPNFRNLKNVELTFEPSLKPAVFPIGSENGGGKSTLLQLIFVLLTCSLDDEKNVYLSNLLSSVVDNCLIAKIEVIYQEKIVDFSFIFRIYQTYDYKELFELINQQKELKYKLYDLEKRREYQNKSLNDEKNTLFPSSNSYFALTNFFKRLVPSIDEQIESCQRKLSQVKKNLKNQLESMKIIMIRSILENSTENTENISDFSPILICKTNCDNLELVSQALKYINNHVYLAIPPTQLFLGLDKISRKNLNINLGQYQTELSQVRENLSKIYIYNQLSITEIINTFKQARDKDFNEAINNFNLEDKNLEYGTALKELIEDFHDFLGSDKYIFPSEDMTSIIVKRKMSENEFIELEPEELSHGELKRLGLYAWIKYNEINDSIILIDEIENGLHPDWQYNIVDELASWGNNQYLLATHSFYVCEALTPSHVKDIKPTMLKPKKPKSED